MSLTYFIVAAALVALLGVVRLGFSHHHRTSGSHDLAQDLTPLDVEAFCNLTDPAEDEYLRRYLSRGEYRKVRRARLRATATYVRMASRNAAVLAQIGQAALIQADSVRADAARRMVNDAFQLRRNATVALARIYVAMAWPNAGSALARFQDQYAKVGASAMLFGRLQDPAHASRFVVTIP